MHLAIVVVHRNLIIKKKKHSENFKSSNQAYTMLLGQGQIFQTIWLSFFPVGCSKKVVTVRCARYSGKMYSSHIFLRSGISLFELLITRMEQLEKYFCNLMTRVNKPGYFSVWVFS